MKPGVFVDANILFSAAYLENSPAAKLFALAEKDDCALYATRFVIDEAVRNIARKRRERVAEVECFAKCLNVASEPRPETVRLANEHVDEKDAPILAGAIESRATLLVTGDRRHFGHLFGTEVHGIRILRLAETLEYLLERLPNR